eukprot:7707931-Pyramimonas_sp.AAC.1
MIPGGRAPPGTQNKRGSTLEHPSHATLTPRLTEGPTNTAASESRQKGHAPKTRNQHREGGNT